jgi:thiol-disulfide isomerase/thioredoxin
MAADDDGQLGCDLLTGSVLMVSFINRYSYLFTSAVVMGVAWLIGARFGGLWPTVAVASTGVGLALVQRTLRGGVSDVATLDAVDQELRKGRPLLLFIYSDTCGACLATRPIVNRLEQEFGDRVDVLRLNVAEDVGMQARQRYESRMVPTILLLDADGVERYRAEGRLPHRKAIIEALAQHA